MTLPEKYKIAVIGAGRIGMGLAVLFTGNGFRTTVLTTRPESIALGKQRYADFFQVLLERKLVTRHQADCSLKRLGFTTNYEDIADFKVVYECAVENLEVKHGIYRQIEKHLADLEVLASATSALSPDDLVKGLEKKKDTLAVAHPFNPPHLVPFVEAVKSEYTSGPAMKLIDEILTYCGRKVVTMKKGAPGFIANRLQHALMREALYMVEQGYASPRDIDTALMYSFMPRYTSVGLFEHQDAAGMDLVKSIEDYLLPSLSNAVSTPEYVVSRCKAGKLGQKTGEGIYTWTQEEKADFARRAAEPYWKYFNWKIPE